MRDPYEVLGVPHDADMDEIKKAYRQLSRKYHPDANINNPNKDQAEEKFKEVQAAYKQIQDEREKGYSSWSDYKETGSAGSGEHGDYGYDPFEEFFGGGFREQQSQRGFNAKNYTAPEMQAAVNYINNGLYQEAITALDQTDQRTAAWYYLRAIANSGLGNMEAAKQDAGTAAEMEPDNTEYQRMHRQLMNGSEWYVEKGRGYGYPDPCGGSGALRSMLSCCICSTLCSLFGCPVGFCWC
ncbi:MAG: DnaJ domain-containing protein [Eubacterium sp.]|nr:DnaJ domain-containing protein [Eubacterium sp.]